MQEQLLANLKDLHMPQPIGAWPLAYGWYVVIALALSATVGTVWAIYYFRKKVRPKKFALQTLQQIEQDYQSHQDTAQAAYQLSVLLKRFCFAYLPRQKLAGLYGESWQAFLGNEPWLKTITQLSYQKPQVDYDLRPLFDDVRNWIRKGGCLN